MDLNKAGNTNDVINVHGLLTEAGTLQVSFSDTRAVGDTFHLLHASSFAGTFDAISPVTPGNGLLWDTSQLATTGTLAVMQGIPFKIGTVNVSGGNIIISGGGGSPNGIYNVLTSTNAALPINQWTIIGPFNFDGSGNFGFTNAVTPGQPQVFYTVQTTQ